MTFLPGDVIIGEVDIAAFKYVTADSEHTPPFFYSQNFVSVKKKEEESHCFQKRLKS
jgi:hypothetical protein